MSNRQVTAKDKNNNTLIFNTTTAAVADVAKGQALSATLADTPDKGTLGYDAFSSSEDYSIGDVVYHDNKIYKFTAAHPAGAWTGTDVEQTSIDEIMYGRILPTKNEVEEARGSQASLGERLDASDTLTQGLALTKADKNGIYPQMQVGLADNLKSPDGITNSEPYLYRTTAGSDSVATGIAELQKIKGNTLVNNQLMYNGDFAIEGTTHAATNTTVWNSEYNRRTVANGKCTVTMLKTSTYSYHCMIVGGSSSHPIDNVAGHKYYISFECTAPKDTYLRAALAKSTSAFDVQSLSTANPATANTRTKMSCILTATSDFNGRVAISATPTNFEVGDTIDFFNMMVIDLTKMFGSGKEPTVAEFEKLFPNDYYPYNTGELISVNVDKLKTVGFNQIKLAGRRKMTDVEWGDHNEPHQLSEDVYIVGYAHSDYKHDYDVVSYSVTDNNITLKTSTYTGSDTYGIGIPVKVFPNTTYYCKANRTGTTTGLIPIGYYDINKQFIGFTSGKINTTFTTPANCYWVILNYNVGAVNSQITYTDICLNLSWSGYRNGEYETYKSNELDLEFIKSIKDANGNTLFPAGLCSVGNVYDEVTPTKAIKRVGVVDLGNVYVSYVSGGRSRFEFDTNLSKHPTSDTVKGNIRTALYDTESSQNVYLHIQDKIIALHTNGDIWVYDSSYTGADIVNNRAPWLAGVKLYLELATPIEVEFDEPLNLTYQMDDFGTEEVIPTTGMMSAPFSADTFYMNNLRDKIRNIDGNTDAGALMNTSLANLLTTLGTALNGTLAKTWDTTNKCWTFTFTPSTPE